MFVLQLWMRELRRMVASVSKEPVLHFADDLSEEQLNNHLPLVHCRDCGSMGWTGMKRKTSSEIRGDLKDYYYCFFNRDPQIVYLFPEGDQSGAQTAKIPAEGVAEAQKVGMYYFCTRCLHVTAQANPKQCPSCEHQELVLVHMPDVRFRKEAINTVITTARTAIPRTALLLSAHGRKSHLVMIVQLYSSILQ